MQVTEAQAKHAATVKPAPGISPLARQMKIKGIVKVDVQIDEGGSVSGVKVAVGTPVLAAGVIDAVRHWKFAPFRDPSGNPTSAQTTLTFEFKQ